MKVFLLGGYAQDGWVSVNRYQEELLPELQKMPGPDRLEARLVSPQPGRLVERLASMEGVGRTLGSYWTRFVVYPRQLPRAPGAIFHLMDQSLSFLLPHLDPSRTVVTCHDLLHFPLRERLRAVSRWPWASERLYRFCVGRLPECAAVIAVSERTRLDAIRYLGCDPTQVHVVHAGVPSAFLKPVDRARVEELRRDLNLVPGQPVLIHVGVPTLYKNVEGLIRSAAALQRTLGRNFTLLRVGPPLHAVQRRLAQELGVRSRIREVGFQSDDRLPLFYRLADVLVFPSLYEGFGFPPLEAMACGVPVIVSDRGALPEVAAEAALRVNPEDPEAIAAAVRRVLEDDTLKKELRARGLEHSRRFRWENHAREVAAVYRRVEQAHGS